MFNQIHSFFRPYLIAYPLLGGCLTLISITPIQAQTPTNSQIIAQLQNLPPGQYEEPDFISPYNQNSDSYLVIVDNTNSGLLQQVKFLEPGAFAGQFLGRSVIQVGVFNDFNNAQQRIVNLKSVGISSRIYSRTTGREVTNSYSNNFDNLRNNNSNAANFDSLRNNNSNAANNTRKRKKKYYYVVIPEKRDKLFQIEQQIKQSSEGNRVGVAIKNSRRGPHVAVGPFSQRFQAEQWNYYLQSLGLNNARVYYGK